LVGVPIKWPYFKLSIKEISVFIHLYRSFLIHLSIRHPTLNVQLLNLCSKFLVALLVRNLFAFTKFTILKTPLEIQPLDHILSNLN